MCEKEERLSENMSGGIQKMKQCNVKIEKKISWQNEIWKNEIVNVRRNMKYQAKWKTMKNENNERAFEKWKRMYQNEEN